MAWKYGQVPVTDEDIDASIAAAEDALWAESVRDTSPVLTEEELREQLPDMFGRPKDKAA